MFHDDSWRDLLEKPEPTRTEIAELVGRVSQYMCLTTSTQLSIAEAMVTYQVSNNQSEALDLILNVFFRTESQTKRTPVKCLFPSYLM